MFSAQGRGRSSCGGGDRPQGDKCRVSKKKGAPLPRGRVDSQWVSTLQRTLASDSTR